MSSIRFTVMLLAAVSAMPAFADSGCTEQFDPVILPFIQSGKLVPSDLRERHIHSKSVPQSPSFDIVIYKLGNGSSTVTIIDPNNPENRLDWSANTQHLVDFLVSSDCGTPTPTPTAGEAPGRAHANTSAGPSSGQAARFTLRADLNGDGNVDDAYVWAGKVQVTLRNADSTVLSSSEYTVDPNAANIVAGDFNGDGHLDLAVTDAWYDAEGGKIQILLNNGDGTFAAAPSVTAGASPSAIAAGDFDGDGKMDLAVTDTDSNAVLVLINSGGGAFKPPVSYKVGNSPGSLIAADFTGDGILDLATVNLTDGSISVLAGNAGGTFKPAVSSPGGYTRGNDADMAWADFNHDNKLDLVVSYSSTNCLSLLLGNGNGTFQASQDYATSAEPFSVGVIPLGDGTLVLFTADALTGDLVMTFSAGDGTLNAPPLYHFRAGGQLAGVAVADLNGDHVPDVVVAGPERSMAEVFVGDGNGGFVSPPVASTLNPTGPTGFALGDLNGDNKPDLVLLNGNNQQEAPGSIGVALGTGGGKFGTETTFSAGNNPSSLLLADLGNGELDAVLVSNGYPAAGPASILVFVGSGSGSFGSPRPYPLGTSCLSTIALGDFTGDGKIDIAATTATGCTAGKTTGTPGNILVFPGHGDGTFGSPISSPISLYAAGTIAVGDFNKDNRTDLAIATATSSGLGIQMLLGKGDGTFQMGPFTPTSNAGNLVTADVDGDTFLDLINTACCGLTDSTYLLGNGDGTFRPEQHIIGALSPVAVAVTDFNSDGQPDLVSAGLTGQIVALQNAFPRMSNVSAANFFQGSPVAPGSLVAAFGRFGTELATSTAQSGAPPPPTTLGGSTISITDSAGVVWPAPLFYATQGGNGAPSQINYAIPAGAALGPATVNLTGGDGISQSAGVLLTPVAPGLIALNASGLVAADVLRLSNGVSEPLEFDYHVEGNQLVPLPINLGPPSDVVYLEMFGTGIEAAGKSGITVTIGGMPATVDYAGVQGTYVGLDQINVIVPHSLAGAGTVPIILTADGQAANTVNVTIQ